MKLKPCPFCGSTRSLDIWDSMHGTMIECDRCGARGPAANDEMVAAAWWNEIKRPPAGVRSRAANRIRALRRQQKREAAEAKAEREQRERPKRAQEREYAAWAKAREAWLRAPVDEDTIQ